MEGFFLEKRLKDEAPELHRRVSDSIVVLQRMLQGFLTWFPDFTDHSVLHSLDVLDFSNRILGEDVKKLTIAECYVLIMSCYLHDIGMGISEKDFEKFSKHLNITDYRLKHSGITDPDTIRNLHNEYSGLFIREYAALFDIPSEELIFSIIQVSRGHRKTDLYDEKEYPDIETEHGLVRTAWLSAIIRLADEIDVAADRNPELLFDTSNLTKQKDIDAFGTHESIQSVEVTDNAIILHVKLKEPRYGALVDDLAGKLQETLDYCRDVAGKRSDMTIHQQNVETLFLQSFTETE